MSCLKDISSHIASLQTNVDAISMILDTFPFDQIKRDVLVGSLVMMLKAIKEDKCTDPIVNRDYMNKRCAEFCLNSGMFQLNALKKPTIDTTTTTLVTSPPDNKEDKRERDPEPEASQPVVSENLVTKKQKTESVKSLEPKPQAKPVPLVVAIKTVQPKRPKAPLSASCAPHKPVTPTLQPTPTPTSTPTPTPIPTQTVVQKSTKQEEKKSVSTSRSSNNLNECVLSVEHIESIIDDIKNDRTIIGGRESSLTSTDSWRHVYYRNRIINLGDKETDKYTTEIYYDDRTQALILSVKDDVKKNNRYVQLNSDENIGKLSCSGKVKDGLLAMIGVIKEIGFVDELCPEKADMYGVNKMVQLQTVSDDE